MIKKYIFNLLISIDQLANTILGGDPDETLSSRMGKMVVRWRVGSTKSQLRYKLAVAICWLLNKIDPDHCNKSIEHNEGDDDIWQHNKNKKD